jgi:hypothetical protein
MKGDETYFEGFCIVNARNEIDIKEINYVHILQRLIVLEPSKVRNF